ncbi:VIP36-like protein [Psilocybe cubensis]|uniref:VIP36-like protein n=2 Tax=Psilocybe cubensis TaxID=181762 RepID=A0ACB8HDD3_PSICU|nr:VIP36-like protein [Psilocybe cubensis]KAH9485662.1 VIP36-like protein [Psilocybe cubensis]
MFFAAQIWWDFGADAYVNTNKHIRLTRNRPSQMGWLWSRLALTPSNYVIEVEFKVSGDSSHLFGDGLAMWITKERAQPGPVFGNRDQFTGLGIILDTYANSKHSYSFPRIVGIIGDGQMKYDFGNDGDSQALGSCSANFRRTNVATKLKVTYVKDSFLDARDDWTDCFRIEKPSLPTAPFLGFSAMTGDVSDAHDIISVTSYSAIVSQPDEPRNKHKKSTLFASSGEGNPGTWLGFFFKLFLLAGVGAGGYYGWKEYKRRQRYSGFGGGMGMGGMGNMGGSVRSPVSAGGTGMGGYGMRSAGVNGGFGDYSSKRY